MPLPIISAGVMEKVKEDNSPCNERLKRFHQKQPNVSRSVAKVLGTGEDGLCVIGAMSDFLFALELQLEMDSKELTLE